MRRISTESPFEAAFGYCRAVVRGPWCFVSGTTGYDYAAMTMPEGTAREADQALTTIRNTLSDAGFGMQDIVRVQYTITDAALADEIAPILARWLGSASPAATMVVAGLIRPEMLVEIEVTAFQG